MDNNSNDSIETIRDEVIQCTKCPELAAYRTKIAFSCGSGSNGVMFIGTAPSYIGGNITGKPMSDGKSRTGALVQEILDENGLASEECYNTNILYCATPNNREPTPREIQNCLPYTRREIAIIQPKLVILLGRIASICFLIPSYRKDVVHHRDNISFFPTYHPAYILRQNNPDLEASYKAQFRRVLSEVRSF